MRDILLEQAQQLISQGNVGAAIESLREILSQDPEDALAHAVLATALLEQLRLHAARYEIDMALRLEPNNAYALIIKARLETLCNNYKQALRLCDDSLRLEPNAVDAYLLKAIIYAGYGNNSKYLEYLEQAAEREPQNEEVLVNFGRYYLVLDDYEKSEFYLRQVLALNAENELANIHMGDIMLLRGNIEEAAYQAKFVLSRNPNSREALGLLTKIKARKSWFLGLWWRWNAKLSSLGSLKATVVMIMLYLIVGFISHLLKDFGHLTLSIFVIYFWIAVVAYTWISIPIFHRMLKKELAQFRFDPNF